MTKFFFTVPRKQLSHSEQDELTTLLAAQVGISREAAVKTLAQWQMSWDDAVVRYHTAVDEAKDIYKTGKSNCR